MCSTRSSATENVAGGRDKTRFPSIVISNTKQGLSGKNMEVISKYKPLQACPTQGTVRELLEWAVPTDEDYCEHGHEGQGRDEGPPAALQDQGDVCEEPTTTI
jgi:hypothetical protein